MKINVNHPSFLSFIDEISNNIQTSVSIYGYFKLSAEAKLAVQILVFKYINHSIKIRVKLTDDELKSFLQVLWKKTENLENYELAAILKDLTISFDSIWDLIKPPPTKRGVRKLKVKRNDNEETE